MNGPRGRVWVAALVFFALASGSATAQTPAPPAKVPSVSSAAPGPGTHTNTPAVPVPEGYVLEPGDQIQVDVYGESDLTRTVTIKPDGTITLSLINEVRAAGKTTTQLEAEIKKMFAKYLKTPAVSVVVTQTRVDHVYLLGQVGRPGDYQLQPKESIFELLSAAGGPTNRADLQKAVIIRGKTQTVNVDLFAAVKNNKDPDVTLQAGDVLFIPETDKRIVALGMVQRPGPYDLLEGQHLSDLIAAAGGLNTKAAMDKAFIVRSGAQTPVDLKKVMAGDATANVSLQAGDMLVVPENRERVLVMGTVGKPGPYDYTENMTVIDAIASAGGATDKSNLSGVQVVRTVDGQTKNIAVKADQAMNGKDLSQNIKLQNGDLVYVPQRGMNLLEIINTIGVFRWLVGF